MNIKHLVIAALGLCLGLPLPAQTAKEILDGAALAYKDAKGVEADFTLQMLEAGGVPGESMRGSILLQGSKFKLTVPDETVVWFDGRNEWLYLADANEVNLSQPDETELLMLNPVNIYLLYQHGYDSRMGTTKTWKGKAVTEVLLSPRDPYSDLQQIEVRFDKAGLYPVCIRLFNKDRSGSVIDINRYQTGKSWPDHLFMFQPHDCPGAEIIDLR